MPLYGNAIDLIRTNLEYCRRNPNSRPRPINIGALTEIQLNAINALRAEDDLPPMGRGVMFIGSHLYKQRAKQNYDVEEMLEQIKSAMSSASVVIETYYMTAMQNPNVRVDRDGNAVYDRAIFECTRKFPNFELISVVPKGDEKAKERE